MNQSALRALQVLEYVSDRGIVGVTDLAVHLGLNKSTAYRFLTALVEAGYVQRTGQDGRYAVTTKILNLASRILDNLDVRAVVRPVLEECARATKETTHLAVIEKDEIVYIDKVEGRRAVHMASRIGARGLCHSTALGKVLLAHWPEDEWRRFVTDKGLARKTPSTIVDPSRLYEELKRVRARGYAFDNIENEEGIRCVGAPVRDHTGTVVCAMSISGWTVSMTRTRTEQLVPIILRSAHRASELLGYDDAEAPTRRERSPDPLAPIS
jgi:DNA-binding IclR family transcriptional regulator